MKNVTRTNLRYLVRDTLKTLKIENETFITNAEAYWNRHFFSNDGVREDVAIAGAAAYVNRLYSAGAEVVYLTGRDEPRMLYGTEANLEALEFPIKKWDNRPEAPDFDYVATLLMKPTPEMDDLEFKKTAFNKIERMGVVTAVFENEPANLNSLASLFSLAQAVFLDTPHSPKPESPRVDIPWVGGFKNDSN